MTQTFDVALSRLQGLLRHEHWPERLVWVDRQGSASKVGRHRSPLSRLHSIGGWWDGDIAAGSAAGTLLGRGAGALGMKRENNLEPRRRPRHLVWAIDGLLFSLGCVGVLIAVAITGALGRSNLDPRPRVGGRPGG